MLQEKIVKFSLTAIDYSTVKMPHIYSSNNCRCKLFETLHSLITSPHHLCPPPLQYGCIIFSTAQIRDPNPKIRESCYKFMKSIERTLHPQKESLHFPIDRCAMKDAFNQDPQHNSTIDNNLPIDEEITDDENDEEEIVEIISCNIDKSKNTTIETNRNETVIHMETETEEVIIY